MPGHGRGPPTYQAAYEYSGSWDRCRPQGNRYGNAAVPCWNLAAVAHEPGHPQSAEAGAAYDPAHRHPWAPGAACCPAGGWAPTWLSRTSAANVTSQLGRISDDGGSMRGGLPAVAWESRSVQIYHTCTHSAIRKRPLPCAVMSDNGDSSLYSFLPC